MRICCFFILHLSKLNIFFSQLVKWGHTFEDVPCFTVFWNFILINNEINGKIIDDQTCSPSQIDLKLLLFLLYCLNFSPHLVLLLLTFNNMFYILFHCNQMMNGNNSQQSAGHMTKNRVKKTFSSRHIRSMCIRGITVMKFIITQFIATCMKEKWKTHIVCIHIMIYMHICTTRFTNFKIFHNDSTKELLIDSSTPQIHSFIIFQILIIY